MSKEGGGTPETCRKRKEPESDLVVQRSVVECPVCLEVFAGKVFQCQEGHVICEKCKGGLPLPKMCPSCRGSLVIDIRCRVLESMAESAEVACGFDGCDFRGLNKGMAEHRRACDHRPYSCPLARIHPCGWNGALKDLEKHLCSQHMATSSYLPGSGSLSVAFRCPSELEECTWSKILIRGSERYLLCCKRERTTKVLRLGLLQLGLSSSPPRLFTLKVSQHGRERSFMCPAMSIRNDKNDMQHLIDTDDCLSISNHTAMYMSAGGAAMPKAELNLIVFVEVE